MRSMFWGAALIIGAATVQPASAQTVSSFYTGQELLDGCKTDSKWCNGYIMGVVDGVSSITTYTKGKKIYCVPRQATMGEITGKVIAYVKTKPDLQYDAPSYVMLALVEAYPC